MTVPMTGEPRPPGFVAGVVDGRLTTAYDQDGNFCLHLRFGADRNRDGVLVECVLSYDDALVLQRSLTEGLGGAADMPCRVGIRLRHGYP